MKLSVDIPDDIFATIQCGTSRQTLKSQFGVSLLQARHYLWLAAHADVPDYQHRLLIIADLHAPDHDPDILSLILGWGTAQRITELVLLGDALDFEQFSRWAKNPRAPHFVDILPTIQRDIFQRIDRTFPTLPKLYLVGNHEQRVKMYQWEKAQAYAGLKALELRELLELSDTWTLEDNIERMQAGKDLLSRGGYYLLHGHECRVGMGVINAAKIYYERHIQRPCILGHVHKTQSWMTRLPNHQHDMAFSVGCVQKLSPGYMTINKWNHGAALLCWNDGETGVVYNRKIINGRFL